MSRSIASLRIRLAFVGLLTALALAVLPAAPVSAAHPKFLTLPFPTARGMAIEAGWWRGDHDLHKGIDYVKGRRGQSWTWESFPVVAAASGWACAASEYSNACIDGVGSRVVIKHRRDGVTWYTYYGHLRTRSIPDRLHLNRNSYGTWVERGDYLGMAGRTGLPGTGIHVHFELITLPFRSWDPYAIYGYASAYPNPPGTNGKTCGSGYFWRVCPPKPPVSSTAGLPPVIASQPASGPMRLVRRPRPIGRRARRRAILPAA